MSAAAFGSIAADQFRPLPDNDPRQEFVCSGKAWLETPISTTSLARGVIGNTPGFDPGIPSSSLGGPVYFNKYFNVERSGRDINGQAA